VPENLTSNPSTDEDWAISKAFPFAMPLATSKRTTSQQVFLNQLNGLKCHQFDQLLLMLFFSRFISL